MAGQGYDIGLSFATSSGASITSPVNITGGSGSSATVANGPGSSGLTPITLAAFFLIVAGVLIGLWIFLGRKR